MERRIKKIKQIEINPKTQGYINGFFDRCEREEKRRNEKKSAQRGKNRVKGVRCETAKTKSNL